MALVKRAALIVGIVFALLVAAAGIAYAVGLVRTVRSAPQLDAKSPAAASSSSDSAPQTTEAPTSDPGGAGSETPTREVPPPDPNSPLARNIPGCVCHSDDPKVVEEHAAYRMNQCFGCHTDGPKMGD